MQSEFQQLIYHNDWLQHAEVTQGSQSRSTQTDPTRDQRRSYPFCQYAIKEKHYERIQLSSGRETCN